MICLHACMYCMCVPTGSLENGVTDNYEPLCACWKLDPGLLQDQQVLLSTEPSLLLLGLCERDTDGR